MSDGSELSGVDKLLLASIVDLVESGQKLLQLPLHVVVVSRGTSRFTSLVGHVLSNVCNDNSETYDDQ